MNDKKSYFRFFIYIVASAPLRKLNDLHLFHQHCKLQEYLQNSVSDINSAFVYFENIQCSHKRHVMIANETILHQRLNDVKVSIHPSKYEVHKYGIASNTRQWKKKQKKQYILQFKQEI